MSDFKGHPDQHYGHLTYSQHGEDLFIISQFKLLGIEYPTYLDIGAHHPINISNTALLYRRGSRGFNVDANEELIGVFNEYRSGDINLRYGIVPEDRKDATYLMFDPRSGRNTFSRDEANLYESISGRTIKSEVKVPMLTLNELVEKHCGNVFPQFLNCDIEGMDFDVISNADFSKNAPIMVCLEVRQNASRETSLMMMSKGYSPLVRMGENIIFLQRCYMPATMKSLGLLD